MHCASGRDPTDACEESGRLDNYRIWILVMSFGNHHLLLFGMLRSAPLSLKRSLRNLHTYANRERQSGFTVGKALSTAVVTGSVLWYSMDRRVHNDALPFSEKQQKLASPSLARLMAREDLSTVAWGSNRHVYYSQSSDFFLTCQCQVRFVVTG